ncbi:hypothetical protein RclHR1_09190008 [Rhizophagus clarus]|uniref:Uncharacterized protein n=1 Tax=Rhizophagus clarus TaxID=94130 RepID=A0A2Z6SHY4_9GLOM|nr:hypothetical protein RclHR1_09190008 [Rhizophagus clarus]GES78681.1 hypothetical protein RCL_jg21576.t1 [Rhizophagus clarus]
MNPLMALFTVNNALTAPTLTGLNLVAFAEDVHRDLTRDNKIRSRTINMHRVLRYLVSRAAEQIGGYDYQTVSDLAEQLMRVATYQDKQQYKELAIHVNRIIVRRRPSNVALH